MKNTPTKQIDQTTYNKITESINLHLQQNKLSPESAHDAIKLEYPDIDGNT